MARVQEQLTSFWEENQSLATHIRDQLAQYESGLMDLREALNQAVNTTREAEELNSRNQERLKEALVSIFASCPVSLCPTLSTLWPPLPQALVFCQLFPCSPSSLYISPPLLGPFCLSPMFSQTQASPPSCSPPPPLSALWCLEPPHYSLSSRSLKMLSQAMETGTVPGQCHPEGHSSSCQSHLGPCF